MRKPIIAGNWKMNNTVAGARALASAVVEGLVPDSPVEVILAPAHTALAATADVVRGSPVQVAAQDMYWADSGAFTGAVSPVMVVELASHVIVGHSERRHVFGETDGDVNRKAHAAHSHGLTPIVCIGETEVERDAGRTDQVIVAQLAAGLEGLAAAEVGASVVAYEPVWAIGSGRACDPGEAVRVIALIRRQLEAMHGVSVAESVRILYGGSVNPTNIAAYLNHLDIDGALVGGASLKAATFLPLVDCALEVAGDVAGERDVSKGS